MTLLNSASFKPANHQTIQRKKKKCNKHQRMRRREWIVSRRCGSKEGRRVIGTGLSRQEAVALLVTVEGLRLLEPSALTGGWGSAVGRRSVDRHGKWRFRVHLKASSRWQCGRGKRWLLCCVAAGGRWVIGGEEDDGLQRGGFQMGFRKGMGIKRGLCLSA